MRSLILLLLASASLFGYTCPTGLTEVDATSSGTLSALVGSGASASNGKCIVTGAYTVTIDQDPGTFGGTGMQLVGSFTTPTIMPAVHACGNGTSASICMFFGSTGSNPCGTGTSTAPNASATMMGMFAAGGNITLNGTSIYRIVAAAANGSSPIYGPTKPPGISGTPNFTLKWVQWINAGSSTVCSGDSAGQPIFSAVAGYYGPGSATVDVEHNFESGGYSLINAQDTTNPSTVTVIDENNVTTGLAGPWRSGAYTYGIGNLTTGGNADSSPAAAHLITSWPRITTSVTDLGGDAAVGNSSYFIGGINVGVIPAGSLLTGRLIVNDPALSNQATNNGGAIGDGNFSFTNSYLEMINQGVAFSGAGITGTISGIVSVSNRLTNGEGIIAEAYGSSVIAFNNICELIDTSTAGGPGDIDCILVYSGTASLTAYNNTSYANIPSGLEPKVYSIGDGGAETNTAYIHNELMVGSWYFSIVDASNTAQTYSTMCSWGGGLCTNATYLNGGGPTGGYYYTVLPNNWQSGATAHPNSLYGDIDGTEPAFLNPHRNFLYEYMCATFADCPGSAQDWIASYAAQSTGWGAADYTLPANPIAAVIAWVRGGFTPGNSAMCPGGAQSGAMQCSAAAGAIIPQ